MRRSYRYDETLGRCVEITRSSEPTKTHQIIVKQNISYQSPATGEVITTWAKRDYDLKASDCVHYAQGKEMALDAQRNRRGVTHGMKLEDIL